MAFSWLSRRLESEGPWRRLANALPLPESFMIRQLLASPAWPAAVAPGLICPEGSAEAAAERGEAILEIVVDADPSGKRFLDFGCGDGAVARAARGAGASLAVGFDPKLAAGGSLAEGLVFTNDPAEAARMGPYDLVLLHDVLDHAAGEEPAKLLARAAGMAAEGGLVIVRCHPWISRHGGHLYSKINKAFLHLALEPGELASLGLEMPPAVKLPNPLAAYSGWIKSSGLAIESEFVARAEVENFFRAYKVLERRILRHFPDMRAGEWPRFQLEQCWVDYRLRKP